MGSQAAGPVAQLVRASSQYAKVAGLIPWSGHIQESTNECINKLEQQQKNAPSPPSSSLSLKSTNKGVKRK